MNLLGRQNMQPTQESRERFTKSENWYAASMGQTGRLTGKAVCH